MWDMLMTVVKGDFVVSINFSTLPVCFYLKVFDENWHVRSVSKLRQEI